MAFNAHHQTSGYWCRYCILIHLLQFGESNKSVFTYEHDGKINNCASCSDMRHNGLSQHIYFIDFIWWSWSALKKAPEYFCGHEKHAINLNN